MGDSRFIRFFSPQCATTRLRVCYYTMAAMAALSLGLLALTLRAARTEAQTVRACRVEALLPGQRVLVFPPPAVKASNIHRTPAAARRKEK